MAASCTRSHEGSLCPLTVDIITLFPRLFDSWLAQGVVSRAITRGLTEVRLHDLRPFGVGRHLVTDDYPFGGGGGMVLKPEPVFGAVESLDLDDDVPIILLSPRGRLFSQRDAGDLSTRSKIVLVAGHYEGIDERIRTHLVTDEISIGDYVLSCGELAAMVVTDAAVRLLPGALAEGAALDESHQAGLLEHPQYTRPADFRGWHVPDILTSGNHAAVAEWRRIESLRTTATQRPDLLAKASLSAADLSQLASFPGEKTNE
ncbi:MAG: tRNA (guanosine(37)-N1)-methyltransferase TrmD [Chloroflexota bacterium]